MSCQHHIRHLSGATYVRRHYTHTHTHTNRHTQRQLGRHSSSYAPSRASQRKMDGQQLSARTQGHRVGVSHLEIMIHMWSVDSASIRSEDNYLSRSHSSWSGCELLPGEDVEWSKGRLVQFSLFQPSALIGSCIGPIAFWNIQDNSLLFPEDSAGRFSDFKRSTLRGEKICRNKTWDCKFYKLALNNSYVETCF